MAVSFGDFLTRIRSSRLHHDIIKFNIPRMPNIGTPRRQYTEKELFLREDREATPDELRLAKNRPNDQNPQINQNSDEDLFEIYPRTESE